MSQRNNVQFNFPVTELLLQSCYIYSKYSPITGFLLQCSCYNYLQSCYSPVIPVVLLQSRYNASVTALVLQPYYTPVTKFLLTSSHYKNAYYNWA